MVLVDCDNARFQRRIKNSLGKVFVSRLNNKDRLSFFLKHSVAMLSQLSILIETYLL